MSDAQTDELAEIQTCPRRAENPGPWAYGDGPDRWESGRWTLSEADAERERAVFLSRHPGGSCASSLWRWSWGPPRTCSYCGGIHPDDAIRLVEDGWEIDATTKAYKRYLNPPGYWSKVRGRLAAAACEAFGGPGPDGTPAWSPTPPVKVYVHHFNEDQVKRFNAAIPVKEIHE